MNLAIKALDERHADCESLPHEHKIIVDKKGMRIVVPLSGDMVLVKEIAYSLGMQHWLLSIGIFAVTITLWAQSASAHQLTPEYVNQWIALHPNAPASEILWMRENTIQPMLAQNIWRFITLGITHIFTGYDHILFLVAMMLTYVSWRDILKLTGTFTVAHSFTLILAGTFYLSVSSRIVEPLIAFSIAYVAITTVLWRSEILHTVGNKLLTIFVFGLVHGLGFAGVLKEVSIPANRYLSSLIFFNVGLEIGQLIIVGIVIVPMLSFVMKNGDAIYAKKGIAILISTLGILWGMQRLFV